MDTHEIAELAESIALALRTVYKAKTVSYTQVIDIVCEMGVTPAEAAAVVAYGIDSGLLRADADGLRAS